MTNTTNEPPRSLRRGNAAWSYATPSPAARKISTRVAFSPTVEIRVVD